MAVVNKNVIPSKYAEAVLTSQYEAVNCRCQITKFTAMNTSAVNASIDVHLVASAGSATADNLLASVMLVPDETYTFPEVVGHLIENGGTIYTIAGTAPSIAIRASGIEIT